MMIKKIILCADDFGVHNAVNEGICQLLAKDRISATSCMTNMADIALEKIKPYYKKKDIGFHFNLTEGSPLSECNSLKKNNLFPTLSRLLIQAQLRSLDYDDIYRELSLQFELFISVLGGLPSHIDGHQHIHHFPVIRDVILDFIKAKELTNKVYLRNTVTNTSFFPMRDWMKQQIIKMTGARTFKKRVLREKFRFNETFAGIYTFNTGVPYRTLFLKFVQHVGDQGLIMCHPSQAIFPQDPISIYRKAEFDYFNSDLFLEDQEAYRFEVV